MKLDKYIFNYARSIGENKPDVYFKMFAKHLSGFKVEDFTTDELNQICKIVGKGIEEDFYRPLQDYMYEKYKDTDVLTELKLIADSGDYEFNDNFRISDGSPLDEALYFVTKATGCCGFYDAQIVIDDKVYKIGFNYGH